MSSPRVFRALLAGAAGLGVLVVASLASCNFDADYQQCLASGHCTTDGAVVPDGSVTDAGSDAGGPGRDGGVTDAGGGQDAGTSDAGGMDSGTQDSGTPDSGTPDSGMDAGVDAGCATTLGATCNGPAQCCPTQMCGQNNTCCWPTGVACVNNGDCCSGTCHNGTKICN